MRRPRPRGSRRAPTTTIECVPFFRPLSHVANGRLSCTDLPSNGATKMGTRPSSVSRPPTENRPASVLDNRPGYTAASFIDRCSVLWASCRRFWHSRAGRGKQAHPHRQGVIFLSVRGASRSRPSTEDERSGPPFAVNGRSCHGALPSPPPPTPVLWPCAHRG